VIALCARPQRTFAERVMGGPFFLFSGPREDPLVIFSSAGGVMPSLRVSHERSFFFDSLSSFPFFVLFLLLFQGLALLLLRLFTDTVQGDAHSLLKEIVDERK